MKIYFDSSAFAKRYVDEPGSDAVEQLCQKATSVGLSVICVPEVMSALNRRLREGSLTAEQYRTAKTRLLAEVRDAMVVNLLPQVIADTVNVLEASPVRTMDAIHVACARQWQAELFVSADKRHLLAARKAKLRMSQV